MAENYIDESAKPLQALDKCRERANKLEIIKKRYLYEIAELICDGMDYSTDMAEDLRRAYKDLIFSAQPAVSDEERAKIAYFISDILRSEIDKEGLDFFGIVRSSKPTTVSYAKNAYSDIAYRIFDLQLGGIYSEYSDGFAAAAQSVYYENSSACILPISADDGSTMLGIARFVEKYDLKKVAVAGINTGGVQNTRFALFTHGIWCGNLADTIEFTVKSDDPFSVGRIMAAARLWGFEKISHNERVSSDNGEKYDVFTMKWSSEDSLNALLVYLTLEFERFNLMGLYKEFEEN